MLQLLAFTDKHLDQAAALVGNRFTRLRQQVPQLPARYQEAEYILPLLQHLLQAAPPGVVAIENGRLVGFLSAWLMPGFRGKHSVYSPEWANAVRVDNGAIIYEEMYRHMAAQWVAEGYVAHYVSLMAHDQEALRTWHWLGFGMLGVDAVRGLQPIQAGSPGLEIRQAGWQDLDTVMELNAGLKQHALSAPYFLINDLSEGHNQAYFEAWIEAPDKAIWLGYVDGEPVAFLRTGPSNPEVAAIIADENTTSIYGAFTLEARRGQDVATTLLARVIAATRSRGQERIAVDYESMNILGARFWRRHAFTPVCFSVVRYIDERLV